jgi:hypothetical protein
MFAVVTAMLGIAMAIGTTVAAHAGTNIVKDHSFGDPWVPRGGSIVYNAGDYIDGDWKVTSGSVTLVDGKSWATEDGGHQSLELSSINPVTGKASAGSISQAISLKKGKIYDVSFWVAENPYAASGTTSNGTASLGGKTVSFSATSNGTPTSPGWKEISFVYTALTNISTSLSFVGSVTNGYGVVIDNVNIHPVPEISTVLGFATVLLLGCLMLRRKRSVEPSQSA